MISHVSWGQRKALGKRYATDPALELEKQRMEEEYGLMMPRAQLSEQKRQFNTNKELEQQKMNASGVSSLIGSAGNMAGTYILTKAFNPTPTVSAIPSATTAIPSATSVAPMSEFAMGGSTQALGASMGYETGTGALGIGANTGVVGAETCTAGSGTMGLGAIAAPIGAGMVGGMVGKSGTGKDVGKALMFGRGGEKEHAAVAGGIAGGIGGAVAAGAAAGSFVPGIGNAVGAVIGGVVGAATSLIDDSWICTATNDEAYMTMEEKVKMNQLKIHAIKNHFGWWNSYLRHGVTLTNAIKEKESNLPEFYGSIRLVLVEPVYKEEDLEKCFKIYLAVTKMLFKAYMPDFEFKEEVE